MMLRPRRLNQAVAWLFMIGSALFALGSVPAYIDLVGARPDALTYFLGSLFFTSASFGQLLQAQTPGMTDVDPTTQLQRVRAVVWTWRPHDDFWLAAVLQFPGTLFFNVSTLVAVSQHIDPSQVQAHVWRPDVLGSILFLVSSAAAMLGVRRDHIPHRFRSWGWWIAGVNLLGSIAFMASAVAARLVTGTTSVVNPQLADAGTFLGALCFLVGAALMLPSWESSLRRAPAS
jgi:hypothetical protein